MSKTDWLNDVIATHNDKVKEDRMSKALDKVIFKAFLPFADVIEEVSDERGNGDGIWVYPIRATQAAESVCSPSQLNEDTVKALVPQLREVAKEIRSNPNPDSCTCGHANEWHEDACSAACTLCSCHAYVYAEGKVPDGEEVKNNQPQGMTEAEMDEAMDSEGEEEDRSGFIDDEGILWVDGGDVRDGDTLVDFRGDEWIFKGIAAQPSPGKSGKVLVGSPDFDPDRDAGINEQVFYPSCFVGLNRI